MATAAILNLLPELIIVNCHFSLAAFYILTNFHECISTGRRTIAFYGNLADSWYSTNVIWSRVPRVRTSLLRVSGSNPLQSWQLMIEFKCRPIWSSHFFRFRRTDKMEGLMGQCPHNFWTRTAPGIGASASSLGAAAGRRDTAEKTVESVE